VATPEKTREQLFDELICTATGTHFSEVADRFVHQAACALTWPKPGDDAASLKTAMFLITELAPKNSTEAALAIQTIATAEAALMFLHRATIPEQPTENIDLNVARAARLMRLHLEQIEAMQKLKGKGGPAEGDSRARPCSRRRPGDRWYCERLQGRGGRGAIAMPNPTPQDRRRGWLKNGNPPGDLTTAPRCGAKTRRGTSCQCPAMKNGRCRLHGGLSTGARTPEGIERIRRAVTKHG
jgi:hypothetical protein